MPKKKTEEELEETTAGAAEETETAAAEAPVEAASATESDDAPETAESGESVVDAVVETVASAVETVAETVSDAVSSVVSAVTGSSDEKAPKQGGKRAEKVGIVSSDKMTKTVTVRVDRLVKHPIYRKYVKRRKKFMAHDDLGASIGDKVRIIETRPLSARKRWRVVEIIQKAEK